MTEQRFKLKYLAPKGKRINYGFRWVTGAPNGYWWDESEKKWRIDDEITGNSSNCATCKTVRAFKRMLRKNPILLKGNPVLVSKWRVQDKKTSKTYSLDVEAIIK